MHPSTTGASDLTVIFKIQDFSGVETRRHITATT
jgi:hypothetical protein